MTFVWLIGSVLSLLLMPQIFKWVKNNRKLSKIPSVSKIPFIGSLLQLLDFKPHNLHLQFGRYVQQFGKSFRASVLGSNVVVTADARYADALLSSSQHLHKHKLYSLLSKWLGNGLLLSHGAHWQVMRKIITPAFHFKILEDFVEVFDRQSTIFVAKLQEFVASDSTVDIYPHVGFLTLDIIAETAMGVSVNAQMDSKSAFVLAVKEVTNVLFTRTVRPHLILTTLLKILAPNMYRKQVEGIAVMHEFTINIIEDRRRGLSETTRSHPADEGMGIRQRMALLDVLLQSSIAGAPLTDNQIRDEVNTFMFEGYDTTNAAISYSLYLLSRHPECQRRLFAEIRAHFGDDLQRPISQRDLLELNYLNCVVKESLRLYPPIPAIGRWLKEDLELVDCTIPAGCNVILLLWEMLRDPDVFDSPTTFRPERFMEDKSCTSAFSYTPFSAGPRNCIGQRFALFEMKTVIIKTLRHYELLDRGVPVEPLIRFVLSSQSGVNMGIKRRVY